MILVHKTTEIQNKKLHNAVYRITLMKYKFFMLGIDPNGECVVTFEGRIPESIIKDFFTDIQENNPLNQNIIYDYDFTYRGNFTDIITKQFWSYWD